MQILQLVVFTRWIHWSDKEFKIAISSITVQVERKSDQNQWLIQTNFNSLFARSESEFITFINAAIDLFINAEGLLLPVAFSSRAKPWMNENILTIMPTVCRIFTAQNDQQTITMCSLPIKLKTKQRIRNDAIIVDEADMKEVEIRRKFGSDFTSWRLAKEAEKLKILHILNDATLPNKEPVFEVTISLSKSNKVLKKVFRSKLVLQSIAEQHLFYSWGSTLNTSIQMNLIWKCKTAKKR